MSFTDPIRRRGIDGRLGLEVETEQSFSAADMGLLVPTARPPAAAGWPLAC